MLYFDLQDISSDVKRSHVSVSNITNEIKLYYILTCKLQILSIGAWKIICIKNSSIVWLQLNVMLLIIFIH